MVKPFIIGTHNSKNMLHLGLSFPIFEMKDRIPGLGASTFATAAPFRFNVVCPTTLSVHGGWPSFHLDLGRVIFERGEIAQFSPDRGVEKGIHPAEDVIFPD